VYHAVTCDPFPPPLQDNIALCALLENIKTEEEVFVCNLHLTWDPMFKDVKVIQMALALTEIETFMQEHNCAK
jgi:CCR4-NOT transcription complex subunit 6